MVEENIAEVTEPEAQAIPEAPAEAEQAPVETPKAPPEPDWKAEAEKHRQDAIAAKAQAERETQLRKTAEGRLAKETETNKRLLRTEEYARRSIPEEERAQVETQVEARATAQAAEDAQRQTAMEEVQAMTDEIHEYAARMGKNLDTDPALASIRELNSKWRYGTALREIRKLSEADQTAKDVARDEARKVAVQTRQERTNIASPRPAGSVSVITADNIDALWIAGKVTDAAYRRFQDEHGI